MVESVFKDWGASACGLGCESTPIVEPGESLELLRQQAELA